jgi:hypothetical protein
VDNGVARRAGALFETMLLETVLQPMAEQMPALGGYGIDVLAQSVAQHDAAGFGAVLARRLEGDRER